LRIFTIGANIFYGSGTLHLYLIISFVQELTGPAFPEKIMHKNFVNRDHPFAFYNYIELKHD
jgi:hypothetical protein